MADSSKINAARQQGVPDDAILASLIRLEPERAEKIQSAQDQGIPSADIINSLARISQPQATLEESAAVTPQALPTEETGASFLTRLKEELPQAIRPTLEAAGSVLGGGFGFAFGGPVGALGGGGLGFAGGRELADIFLGEQNESLGEELVEAGENVLEGAKLEALGMIGGSLLTKAGKSLFKAAAKPVSAKIAKTADKLKSAQAIDTPITLGEATESVTLQKGENFLRKLITPAGQFQRYDQTRLDSLLKARFNLLNDISKGGARKESAEALGIQIQKEVDTLLAGKVQARGRVLNKLKNEVLEVFGSAESYEQLGRTTKEIVESKQREFEGLASSFFNKARNTLPRRGADIVKTDNVVRAIDRAIKEEGKALTAVGQRNISVLSSIKEDFIEKIDIPESQILDVAGRPAVPAISRTAPKQITYDSFVRRRSDLNDIISRFETTAGLPGEQQLVVSGKKASRLFRSIKGALDDDLANFAKDVGGESNDLLRLGIETSKKKFEFIQNPVIKRLIKSDPEKIVDLLPRNPGLIKTLKNELGEAGITPLRQVTTNNLLGVGVDEPFSVAALKGRVKRFGEGPLRELLGEDSFLSLKDFMSKATAQERVIARFQTAGVSPKGIDLSDIDMSGNKFFRSLVSNQRPQNLTDLIYQPGNTRNIKRTYAILRQAGKPEKIQDLKAAWIESKMRLDPKTGFFHPDTLAKEVKSLDKATLEAMFSPEELKGFTDIANVSLLAEPKVSGGAGLEVIRFVAEPVGKPLAWVYLKKDGRNLLKKAFEQQVRGATKAQRDATIRRLLTIGILSKAQDDARNLE